MQLAGSRWHFSIEDSRFGRWLTEAVADIAAGISAPGIRISEKAEDADVIVTSTRAGTSRNDLGPDDFIIQPTADSGRQQISIIGGSDRGASYGVFELLETLGCRFLISGDILPDDPSPEIPALDVQVTCPSPVRSIWISHCITTTSMMSLVDYEALFDQMAKMRLNRVIFYHFDCDPYIDYSYRGVRKLVGDIADPESGYISYGRFHGSYRTDDIEIGRDLFGERVRVAPHPLQRVSTSDEALDAAKEFMREIMRAGKRRGIEVWLHVLPQFVSPNLSVFTREMPRWHPHWSYWVSCTDPVARKINHERIRGITESYPDLGGLSLGIPEGFFDDPYPDSQRLVEERFPDYAEALKLQQEHWGEFWKGEALQKDHIRADIAFTEILMHAIESAREIAPDLPLAITTVCKAYLLVRLHELLPKNIGFYDIESSSLWTLSGAPLHLFERMQGRECAIIPRAVDDGSLAGMQFNIGLYDRDGFIRSGREHGTRGFVIQLTHVAGNEHNCDYLRTGLWNPDLSTEGYYREYATTVFGAAAADPVVSACRILDANEIELGGRGGSNMPWNQQPGQIAALRKLREHERRFYDSPFDDGFIASQQDRRTAYSEAAGRLREAASWFERALLLCRPGGKQLLLDLIGRNEAYLSHLEALATLIDGFERFHETMCSRGSEDHDMFVSRLEQAIETADHAHKHAVASAERIAGIVRGVSDLGILHSLNIAMVKGTRLFRDYLANILAFYQGREYWHPLEWDTVFGTPVFPTYEMCRTEEAVESGYEPG